MEFIFLILVLIIFGIQKLVEHSDQLEKGYKPKSTAYHGPVHDDDRYLERVFVLDAAASGVFVPGAEKVFDDAEEEEYRYYEEYTDDSDYYSSYDDNEYEDRDL